MRQPGGVGSFGHELSNDLTFHEARSQASIRNDPGYGARPQPGDGTPADGNAYNPKTADKVPAWGENGSTTSGLLVSGDNVEAPIVSGRTTPNGQVIQGLQPKALEDTGMDWHLRTHVEAQAGISMRMNQIDNATLYINRAMCTVGTGGGCAAQISTYLGAGQKLTLYGPNGGTVIEGTGLPSQE